MPCIASPPLVCNSLPLFAWAEKQHPQNTDTKKMPLPYAAQKLTQKFNFSSATARLLAEHAGFAMEKFQ